MFSIRYVMFIQLLLFCNHFIVAFAKLKHCVEFLKGFDSVKYETNHIW